MRIDRKYRSRLGFYIAKLFELDSDTLTQNNLQSLQVKNII